MGRCWAGVMVWEQSGGAVHVYLYHPWEYLFEHRTYGNIPMSIEPIGIFVEVNNPWEYLHERENMGPVWEH